MAHGGDPNNPVFSLPDLGEGLADAELVDWLVQVGDTVEEGKNLATVETAKALTEVAADRGGTIAQLHGEPGDVVNVGAPFVTYAAAGGAASSNGKHEEQDAETLRQNNEAEDQFDEESREDAGTVVGTLGALGGTTAEAGKALATPAVRRMARDLGVDLAAVEGTGLGGRVTAGDVKAAAKSDSKPQRSAPLDEPPHGLEKVPPRDLDSPGSTGRLPNRLPTPDAPPFSPGDEAESVKIPFRGIRRTIAARLRASIDHAVHFCVMDEADVTALDAARKRLNVAAGEKLSLLPFVCVAVARVLGGEFGWQLARVNSRVDDDNNVITQYRRVHLGIAADTPSGLMVPVVRDAGTLGVLELGRKITQIAAACRDRSIGREDLEGSTFTVSNFGSYAGRFATPVINYPEAGILAVGRMREGVVVKNGMMGVGKLLPLSLTCDHRVIDGGTATMTLAKIIELLQSPDALLPAHHGGTEARSQK